MKNLKAIRGERQFLMFSGSVLALTCLAKTVSAFGASDVLRLPDALFSIQNRWVMLIVAATEALVIAILLSRVARPIKLISLLWLSLNFSVYRICRWLIGASTPCACLGNLYGVTGRDAATVDSAMLGILLTLLAGTLYFCYKSDEFCLFRWRISAFRSCGARIFKVPTNT